MTTFHHEIKGESIVIFAILRQRYSPSQELEKELKGHLRKTVGPIATPERIYFVSKLPKTRSGKIMRRVLKALVSDKPIGDVTTISDAASIGEAKRAYEEFKKLMKR